MENSKRKLSNVRLTREFHFRYLGLWVLLTIGLVVVANLLFLLLTEHRWQELYSLDTHFHDEYMFQRRLMIMAIGFEMLVFSAAIVVLAKFTAHRIAGPYIKLRNVFDAVRRGDLDHELRFRKGDHLEALETSFNEMMKEVRARAKANSSV